MPITAVGSSSGPIRLVGCPSGPETGTISRGAEGESGACESVGPWG